MMHRPPHPPPSYMKISVCIQLPSILEPDNVRSWLALGYTKKDNLVAQPVFIVKMRGLGDLGPLEEESLTNLQIFPGNYLFASIPLGSPVILPVLSVRSTNLIKN